VDEDVPLADRAPDVGGALEGGDGVRDERPVLEAREVDRRIELTEVGERREPLPGVEIRGLQLELVHEPGEHLRRQIGIVLETDRVTHPALAEALLDLLQEVSGPPAGRGLDVRVTGHAYRVGREDLVPVVEPRQVEADHVLEEDEVVLAGSDSRGRESASRARRPRPAAGRRSSRIYLAVIPAQSRNARLPSGCGSRVMRAR
jgi:hypothetical protein